MGQQTGDQQNFSPPPLPHVPRENGGEGGQTRDIQLHHRQHRVERSVGKRALQSMASVVDQDVYRNAPFAKPLLQLDDGGDIGKIDLLHNDLNSVLLAELFSQNLQPVQAARDQNQRMALLGVL